MQHNFQTIVSISFHKSIFRDYVKTMPLTRTATPLMLNKYIYDNKQKFDALETKHSKQQTMDHPNSKSNANQKLAMKKSDFMNSVDKNIPKSDGFL